MTNQDIQMNDEQRYFLRIYLGFFRNGLARELGSDLSMTLICLASHMNKNGECFPTHADLAELLGTSRQTISERIKRLEAFRFNGEAVIEVKQRGRNKVYRVLPSSYLAIF
ncbi:helix-turn-helix domain-containing protein [Cohnella lupini]|uniref:Helix-turn-helix protein n=1 Tax=Cohnella lupini TaxID=1294267 RepID=A0A3D9HNQ9_9BACL|nr:helix-turn-helix domain-containing protein [Cohnella lupini]RED51134.1 helix-turn-helix protein [Cohnella lupini]